MINKPNIVYIISHDTGRHIGPYGKKVHTPALNMLADEGIRFDQYFCSQPQCSPSRGSILTGKYSHNHGMMGLAHMGFSMDEANATLPRELSKNGYETHLFGFFHESINGERNAETLGYQHFWKVPGNASEKVTDKFVDFLNNHSSDKPLFLSVGFEETHRPFDLFEEDADENIDIPPYLPDTPEVRKDVAKFQGSVKEMDRAVSRIIDSLKEHNLEENTVVIYTTDHGIAFPRAKGTLKDSGLETSLIMRFPKGFTKSGIVIEELLCNVDLMPTLLDLIGADIPNDIDGKSFLPLLVEKDYEPRDHFFCELTWHDRYHPMRGIRTNRYKYIRNFEDGPKVYLPFDLHESPSGMVVRDQYYVSNEPEELYDLELDPLEENNIIAEDTYQEIAEQLRNRVLIWMKETNDPLLNGPIPGIEADEWEDEVKNARVYKGKD
ncbi:sulfatase [Bacillus salitolerans]|uniref:Sulfatase n=1 Tax=Bacillus salitolerans TaxID=1437434 RepID=A0ABW4LTC8_9BACI